MDTILFIRTFSNGKPVYQTRLEGVIHVARERGWQVQTVDKPAPADVGALLRFWNPLGCIVESGSFANAYRPRLFGSTPVVYLDRDPETLRNVFCVSCDNRATAATAARELLSLGIENFAFVPNFTSVSWSLSREREFRQLLKLNGRTVDVFRPTARGETPEWRKGLAEWLVGLPKPCAVMAANDPVGEAVLVTAASLGIAVPDELAVVGVDNSEIICKNTQPSLSSVALDFIGAGKISAELLAERILHPDMEPCCRRFSPIGVVRRSSTRRFSYRDSRIIAAVNLINLEACGKLSVSRVVEAMGCSRRLAEQRFRDQTGKSILAAIQDVRIERACTLLRTTRATTNAIANACGYSKDVFLQKQFRKRFGESMSDYRGRTPPRTYETANQR